MIFRRLRLRNFGPYKGEHSLDLTTQPSRRLIIVFGDNMRGKTSLLNAFRWVLYGQALDRRSQPVDLIRLINTDAQHEHDWAISVSLTFEHEGSGYELLRQSIRRPIVATPRHSGDFEHSLQLRKDGAVLSQDTIEHYLNQMIPAQVSRFYLFDGELLQEYEQLLIDDGRQGEDIKIAIEHVLGVPALLNGRDHARTLLKQAQARQAKDLKHINALKSYGEQMEALQAEIRSHEADLGDLRGKLAATNSDIEELERALLETQGVEGDKAELDGHRATQKRLLDEERQLRDERVKVTRNAWKDLLQPRLRSHIRDLENAKRAHEAAIEQRGNVRARVDQLCSLLNTNRCPLCDHSISDGDRERFGAQRGALEGELHASDTHINEVGRINAALSRYEKLRTSGATEALQVNQRQLANIAVQLTRVESDIERTTERIAGYDTAEIASRRAKSKRLIEFRGKLSSDLASIEGTQRHKQRELDALSRLASAKTGSLAKRSTREVEICRALDAVYSSAIEKLRDELRRVVEGEATAVFKRLTTEQSYLGLRINSYYGLTIVDSQGRDVTVRSAGAEQVVALALIAALNRTVGKPAPVVMDTPLGRLDPKHRRNILRFISEMAEQVLLLVHEGESDPDRDLGELRNSVSREYELERISSAQSAVRPRLGGEA